MEAKDIENEVERRLKALSTLKRLLKAYGESKDSPFRRKGLISEMKKLKEAVGLDSFFKWIEDEERRIREEEDIFKSEMGGALLRALSERGFTVKGQFPILRFGFYTLKVSFEKPRADLYWGPEAEPLLLNIPLSVDDILREFERVHREIVNRDFNAEKFDGLLLRAYRRLICDRGGDSRKVKIVELLGEFAFLNQREAFSENPLKRNFTEYPRHFFSYDLYRLRKTGGRWRFTVAPFEATTRKRDSLWIPDDEEGNGTYYAYVEIGDG